MEGKKQAGPYHDFLIFIESKNDKDQLIRLIIDEGIIRARTRNEALKILQQRIARGKYDVDGRTARRFNRANKSLKCKKVTDAFSSQERLMRAIFYNRVDGPFKHYWKKK